MLSTVRSKKRQGIDFLLELPEEFSPDDVLILDF
jgi:hypothetical protein